VGAKGSAQKSGLLESVCRSPLRGNSQFSALLIVPKHVHVAVVGVDFEPALHWREPAIDHSAHGEAALSEPESKRLLFAAIAGVALDANRDAVTIPLHPAPRMGH
jgi:hypothetical protein